MREMTWNGLWTGDARYNRKIIAILASVEIMVAFSPLGFINLGNTTITFLHLFVLAAALWGGPIGGAILGFTFGMCSLWEAEIVAVYDTDIIFAPFKSGNPLGSLFLSVGTRTLFGLIAGIIFWWICKYVQRHQMVVIVIAAVILERFHMILVAFFAEILFSNKVDFMEALRVSRGAETVMMFIFATIVIGVCLWIFQGYASKRYFEEYKRIKTVSGDSLVFRIIAFNLCMMLVILLILHMSSSIRTILTLENVEVAESAQTRFYSLTVQFICTFTAAFSLYMELADHYRGLREVAGREAGQGEHPVDLEIEKKENEARNLFLSSLSHGIRTPMNGIVGMTNIAQKNINNPQKVRECLRKIEFASNRLVTIVNDVLDISKIENGSIAIHANVFSLEESMDNLELMVSPMMAAHKLEYHFNRKGLENVWIYADEIRLNQIGMNLLSNAIAYTKEGGKIDVSLCVNVSDKGTDYINISFVVEDTGIGMSEEFMEKMYEPFTRENADRLTEIEGTGLGLTITKQLVDAMNGDIQVNSVINQGTKVVVTLDVLVAEEMKREEGESSDINETMRKDRYEGLHVLIAEDSDLNWEIAKELLEEYQIQCDRASDGIQCVNMLISEETPEYDFVLMDIQMPRMNGYEAAKTIRGLSESSISNIPIIAMTANAFAEDIVACLDAGMNAHIAKPIDIHLLLMEIKNYVLK